MPCRAARAGEPVWRHSRARSCLLDSGRPVGRGQTQGQRAASELGCISSRRSVVILYLRRCMPCAAIGIYRASDRLTATLPLDKECLVYLVNRRFVHGQNECFRMTTFGRAPPHRRQSCQTHAAAGFPWRDFPSNRTAAHAARLSGLRLPQSCGRLLSSRSAGAICNSISAGLASRRNLQKSCYANMTVSRSLEAARRYF